LFILKPLLNTKIILHEQNSHLGKVNRIFAAFVDKIALSFPQTSGIKNEFLTKTSFLLIFFYPFFSYYIFGAEKLKKNQKIYLGLLSGLIISLKPNFIILVALFEIFRIFKSRNIKSLFALHNFVCLFLIILYAIIIFVFFRSFVENFSYMMRIYFEYISDYQNKTLFDKYLRFYMFFLENYFIYIILFFIYFKKLEKNQLTSYLFLLTLAIFAIILTENYFLDQSVVFHSLFLSFAIINFINYLKQNTIKMAKESWLLIFPLIIFCFLSIDFFKLTFLNLKG
jgi:hypothetical protein